MRQRLQWLYICPLLHRSQLLSRQLAQWPEVRAHVQRGICQLPCSPLRPLPEHHLRQLISGTCMLCMLGGGLQGICTLPSSPSLPAPRLSIERSRDQPGPLEGIVLGSCCAVAWLLPTAALLGLRGVARGARISEEVGVRAGEVVEHRWGGPIWVPGREWAALADGGRLGL